MGNGRATEGGRWCGSCAREHPHAACYAHPHVAPPFVGGVLGVPMQATNVRRVLLRGCWM